MAITNTRFGLCFLVIIFARLVTADPYSPLTRLYELLSKNRRPVLLVLDHADLKATHLDDNKAYNSLDEEDALSPFLNKLNQNSMLSVKYPLIQTESNRIKYHQDNLDRNNPKDVKYRYKLDQEKNQQGNRNQQNRNRDRRYRYRNRHSKNRNQQNRYRGQQDRDRNLQDRYGEELLHELDKYTDLLSQQKYHEHYENTNDRDRSQSPFDREVYDRQRYNDRRERKRRQRTPSPVVRSLLRMSNSLRCGARDQCQDECATDDSKEKDSCENECEEKFECEDEKEVAVTGSTKGARLEREETKCKRC